jgi:iron complex transport system substrate-binding protein
MYRRNLLIKQFVALFAMWVLLTACAAPQAAAPVASATEIATVQPRASATTADNAITGFPRTITDGAGRELTFDSPPQRVVALYNDNYGMLATLDVRPVAALANGEMLADPTYFENGESIPSVAGPDGEIDLEIIASVKPDLILAYSLEEAQAMETIAPVYIPSDGSGLEALYARLRAIATIFGLEEEAEQRIANFQDRFEAYKTLAPRDVSIVLAAPEEDNLNSMWIRANTSEDCQILNEIARCDWPNLGSNSGSWSYQTSTEGLLDLNPDYIYYKTKWDGTLEELYEYVKSDPLWAELDAVQNGRLLHVLGYGNPIASSLPAATKLLDTFAPLLYPNIFPAPLTDAEVQEILGAEVDAPASYTITDVNGNTLTFDAPPSRFVSGGNRDIEMLAALGIALAGVADVGHLLEMLQSPVYFPQPLDIAIIP